MDYSENEKVKKLDGWEKYLTEYWIENNIVKILTHIDLDHDNLTFTQQ